MDKNLAIILWQLCYGKISFIVLVPGQRGLPNRPKAFGGRIGFGSGSIAQSRPRNSKSRIRLGKKRLKMPQWTISVGGSLLTLTKKFRDRRLLAVSRKWSRKYQKLKASFATFLQCLHLNNCVVVPSVVILLINLLVSVTRRVIV